MLGEVLQNDTFKYIILHIFDFEHYKINFWSIILHMKDALH